MRRGTCYARLLTSAAAATLAEQLLGTSRVELGLADAAVVIGVYRLESGLAETSHATVLHRLRVALRTGAVRDARVAARQVLGRSLGHDGAASQQQHGRGDVNKLHARSSRIWVVA